MPYTLQEKAVFEYRLKLAKKAFKAKKIRYYSPALNALPREVKEIVGNVSAQQLRNTMNAGVMNTQALVVLEYLGGIASPELQSLATA